MVCILSGIWYLIFFVSQGDGTKRVVLSWDDSANRLLPTSGLLNHAMVCWDLLQNCLAKAAVRCWQVLVLLLEDIKMNAANAMKSCLNEAYINGRKHTVLQGVFQASLILSREREEGCLVLNLCVGSTCHHVIHDFNVLDTMMKIFADWKMLVILTKVLLERPTLKKSALFKLESLQKRTICLQFSQQWNSMKATEGCSEKACKNWNTAVV